MMEGVRQEWIGYPGPLRRQQSKIDYEDEFEYD